MDRSEHLTQEEEDLLTRKKKEDGYGYPAGPLSYEDVEIIGEADVDMTVVPDSFKSVVMRKDGGATPVIEFSNTINNDGSNASARENGNPGIKNAYSQKQDEGISFFKDPEGDEACIYVSIDKQERE